MGSVRTFSGFLVSLGGHLFSSEVEPACLRALRHRFPTLHHLGDVQLVTDGVVEQLIAEHLQDFDILLLAGGSPCQQLNNAGNSRDGPRRC